MKTHTPPSSPPIGDDELKRRNGIDEERCESGYQEEFTSTQSLQRHLAANYLEPTLGDILDGSTAIKSLARNGRVAMVIPMRERGPVAKPVLDTLVPILADQSVLVVNDESDDDAIHAVQDHPSVAMVWRNDILDALDWKRLLPILNLSERPRGKGVAVLAGYLWQYIKATMTGNQPDWLLQHDAEIAEYQRYRGFDYLLWAILQRADAHCVKIAKFGRTNERCMAARCMLAVLQECSQIDSQIRRRAGQLFDSLVSHKWMLTGEFGLNWELAMNRPFATGYLEETLTAITAEDLGALKHRATVHVANPNPRLDAANDEAKEAKMQQQISNFILMLTLEAPAVTHWTVETITALNQGCMARSIRMGFIPPNDHSVVAAVLPNDRIIPSITMLDRQGLINRPLAEEIVERTLSH